MVDQAHWASLPPLHVIAALDEGAGVGLNNALPWSHPEDLRRFQALTEGFPIVMGRATFESLGRPLPRRPNVVLTRDPSWAERCRLAYPGVMVLNGWDEVVMWVRHAQPWRWFAIGGPALWALALPLATRLHLTQVKGKHPVDTTFPAWDRSAWQRVLHDERPGFSFDDWIPAGVVWNNPDEFQTFGRPKAYVDLDGVIADFGRACRASNLAPDDYKRQPLAYRHLFTVPGSYEGLAALEASGWEVWFATKPPADNPQAASEKMLWLHERWPEWRHRVAITFDKGALGGPDDLLIDDRPHKANAQAFPGRLVTFGAGQAVADWAELLTDLSEGRWRPSR